jgi:hypothetical protein
MGLYEIYMSHPYLTTAAVKEQLQNLGIDPERVSIDEDEEEPEMD